MMRFRGERADGGTQIGEILDQPEAIDLQTTGATVLGLQENRRRKLARQRGLADALLTVNQDPWSQHCGNCVDACEVHLLSPWPAMRSSTAPSGVEALPSPSRSTARCNVSNGHPNCSARL